MTYTEKVLAAMEQKQIWKYSEIAEAAGISRNILSKCMPSLYRSGDVVKTTDGTKTYYSLGKHADYVRRKIEFDNLPPEYQHFIGRQKLYDRCFLKFMKRHTNG